MIHYASQYGSIRAAIEAALNTKENPIHITAVMDLHDKQVSWQVVRNAIPSGKYTTRVMPAGMFIWRKWR